MQWLTEKGFPETHKSGESCRQATFNYAQKVTEEKGQMNNKNEKMLAFIGSQRKTRENNEFLTHHRAET